MTASLLWMIVVDYKRPWHAYQDGYFLDKAGFAHLDYLESIRQESQNEIEKARQELASAKQLDAETNATKRESLRTELAAADLEFVQAKSSWSQKEQLLQVTNDSYERIRNALGADAKQTQEAFKQLSADRAEVVELQGKKEHWEDRKRELQAELKKLDASVKSAQKRLDDLVQVQASALQKDQDYRGVLSDEGLLGGIPLVSAIINAPMLDFTAPKNTPGRRQVNQLVLPDIRQQLNYLESYTTDRCTTCHVSIDDPDFLPDRLARRLERAIPGINEELQRRGEKPLDFPPPPVLEAQGAQPLQAGQVTDHWAELSAEQQKGYLDALTGVVNRYFASTGRKTLQLEQPLLAHPKLDLFVSVDSAHPMAQIGCTVCHEGNSQETDFVLAAHSAPTHKIEEQWAEEHYTRVLGVPTTTFKTVAHYWDRPMFLSTHSQAGCAKCHTEISDIARFEGRREGDRLNQGRHLFQSLGCINCHVVESMADARKVGPDLSHVASKLSPGFVQQWVNFPQKFRPSTRMPHFFLQENNRAQSANRYDTDPVLRTEVEVAAITKYLMSVSKPWKPEAPPEGVKGDAERGRQLFRQTGCTGCHPNVTEYGEEWIVKDLAARRNVDEQTAGFQYKGMSQEERVKYAMDNFPSEQDSFLRPEEARFNPDAAHHRPVFSRFGPELSGIGSKVSYEWLYAWLMNPHAYAPDTKMPSMRLTPPEAADLAAYLGTLKNDRFAQSEFEINAKRQEKADELILTLLSAQRSERQSRAMLNDTSGELSQTLVSMLATSLGQQPAYDLISPMSLQDKKLMFLGNKMVAHYGCYACHEIAGFQGTTPPGTELTIWAERPISQLDFAFYNHAFHDVRERKEDIFGHVYPLDAEELNYWSPGENPREEITHTHAGFAKHKMLNPRIWDREKIKKPYDKLKMPNFYLSQEEAESLTTYLLSRRSPRVNPTARVDYEGETAGPIAAGRSLVRELNCIGCHEIEDNVPTIQQYYHREIGGKKVVDEINSPPRLWGEGAKVQHHWLHGFLQHVEPLRPWLAVRMPSFKLSNEEATTLAEYFAALSKQDAEDLNKSLNVVKEQTAAEAAKSGSASMERWYDADPKWYERDGLRRIASKLRRFAVERKLIRPTEADALRSDADRVRAAHAKILNRTEFLKNLYDVPYPFSEPQRPLSSSERFEKGSAFLNDMGCLKCHVLGDMLPGPATNTDQFVQMYRLDSVRGEGAAAVAMFNGQPYPVGTTIDGMKLISAENIFHSNGDIETKAVVEGNNADGKSERVVLQAPSAPNLKLTYKRLRRGWVFNWMLQPDWIQPGTKMPQNFLDKKSPFEGDPRYPGTGIDHINLLLDYLYDAGAQNTRAPLVKSVLKESAEEFEEGGAKKQEEFED